MERLIGPNLEVIVSLNEGYDFGYLSSPFVIVATLDGNSIETNTFDADQYIKFNSELIWLSNKGNIKKMKNFKVPIRLDFFKIQAHGARQNFGYIILSLKTAQYVPKGTYVAVREDLMKVVGLGKDAKGSNPQVQLSLRIQDVDDNDGLSSSHTVSDSKEDNTRTGSESSLPVILPASASDVRSRSEEVPQIPPQPEAPANIVVVCDKKPANVQLATSHVVSKSVTNEVLAYHSLHLEIFLEDILWHSDFTDIHFRFHHARADVTWSAHADIRMAESGSTTNLRTISAQLRFIEAPRHVNALLSEVPPVLSVCTLRHGRPVVLAKAVLKAPTLEDGTIRSTAHLNDLKSQEKVATLSYNAKLVDNGSQTFHQLYFENNDEGCLTDRAKDELEMWKEKQRTTFREECNRKLQSELKELQAAWEARQHELEKEATERMEECRRLGEVLLQATEDVKKRGAECEEQEKILEKTKAKLENGYQALVAEARHETARLREDLVANLKEKDQLIEELKRENEELKREVESTRKISDSLTREQTENLLQDMKKLQEKLERANNSKMFFKEQWGRAVREVHRIKTDGWKDIQVQLHYKKEELKQMGLEHLLSTDNAGTRDVNRGDHGNDEKLRKLIEERDFLLLSDAGEVDQEKLACLNREIRQLLEF